MLNTTNRFYHTLRFSVRHIIAISQLCMLAAGHKGRHHHPDCTDWSTPRFESGLRGAILPLT
jgi:hypothetical protein